MSMSKEIQTQMNPMYGMIALMDDATQKRIRDTKNELAEHIRKRLSDELKFSTKPGIDAVFIITLLMSELICEYEKKV